MSGQSRRARAELDLLTPLIYSSGIFLEYRPSSLEYFCWNMVLLGEEKCVRAKRERHPCADYGARYTRATGASRAPANLKAWFQRGGRGAPGARLRPSSYQKAPRCEPNFEKLRVCTPPKSMILHRMVHSDSAKSVLIDLPVPPGPKQRVLAPLQDAQGAAGCPRHRPE